MAMAQHGIANYDWGEGGPKINFKTIKRMAGYFRPYRIQLSLVVVFAFVAAVLSVVQPILVRFLIDDILVTGSTEDRAFMLVLVAGMVAAPIGAGLTNVAQFHFNNVMVQRVMFDIRNQLYTHLLDMPLRFYTKTRSGEIISRTTNDVNGIQTVLTTSFTGVTTNILVVVITVAAMFWIDWALAIVALIALPFFLFPTLKVAEYRLRVGRRVQEAMGDMTATLSDKLNIGGLILVKTFSQQDMERRHFSEQNRAVMDNQIRQQNIGRWFFMFTNLFTQVGPAALYGYGGWRVLDGSLGLGEVVAFVLLTQRLFQPVAQLLNFQVDVAGSVALFERIFQYLDMSKEIEEKENAIDVATVKGEVAFEKLSFEYDPGTPVIHDADITAKPGQLVALVGPSGAGKTTLMYLLMRLYDPTAGRITMDGHDLRDYSLSSLGRHIGAVTQETHLFHATVKENLLYARLDATDEEMQRATRAAHIHDVIMDMPNGYDTVVGERGYRLSGGEKQRLAIARIILKNPEILVLDEATSSLDTISERLIQAALERLMEGRTSFVIAHRLSTILAADLILVLDGGQIVERGTHQELQSKGGLYARLYDEQFKQQTEEAEAMA